MAEREDEGNTIKNKKNEDLGIIHSFFSLIGRARVSAFVGLDFVPPSVQWKRGRVKILESCILTDGGFGSLVPDKSSAQVSSAAFWVRKKNPWKGGLPGKGGRYYRKHSENERRRENRWRGFDSGQCSKNHTRYKGNSRESLG